MKGSADPRYEVQVPEEGVCAPLLGHVPHGATAVPEPWRSQLVLGDSALERELLAMTDRHTEALFAPACLAQGGTAFVNRISRLVFDPERFEDDDLEAMARLGMGMVYTRTSTLAPLRADDPSHAARDAILSELSRPYAAALEREVAGQLSRFGRCLLIDGHSFPSRPLPYEEVDRDRPDLCLGHEPFHAPQPLLAVLERTAARAGWRVGHNTPFAGSYVPKAFYREDPRVVSVMFEINRRRYMNEETGAPCEGFEETLALIHRLVSAAVLFEAFRATSYVARTPEGELALRIGQRCEALDRLLATSRHSSWAYVTGWNPGGRPAPDARNERAASELEQLLRDRGLAFHRGEGRGDLGDWPPEASVLVLGIERDEALRLGLRFGQAAVVVGERGGEAELLVCDDEVREE